MEPSATSSTRVTGPVGERLQAGNEDAPVLDRLAPLKRLRDSGAGYKCPYLLAYLLMQQPLRKTLPRRILSHAAAPTLRDGIGPTHWRQSRIRQLVAVDIFAKVEKAGDFCRPNVERYFSTFGHSTRSNWTRLCVLGFKLSGSCGCS